jgi:NADH-quinone oxidoreductase subunit F
MTLQNPAATRIEGNQVGDGRYAAIDRVLEKMAYQKDALLEALITAQEESGYLSKDVLTYIAKKLRLPLSQVYGVATFYDMLSLESVGRRHIMICTDPACAIAGAEDILSETCQRVGIDAPGQTSSDGTYSVKRVACLGLCDQAPAGLVNGKAQVDLTVSDIDDLLLGQAIPSRLQVSGEPRILTRNIGKLDPTDLDAHRADSTFKALEIALTRQTPEEVIEEVKRSKLVGRGGAGFPTGLKWEFTRGAKGVPKYAVCNFDESEPGTFKDRVLVMGDPYRVVEGLMLCAYAIGSEHGYIFVRGEYQEAQQVLHQAVEVLYAANLLGDNILGTGFNFDLEIRRGAGAYICGEETALFEAIEGNRGHPRSKPPYPTTQGLFGKPTAINNVETLAVIPDLVLNGGQWYSQLGTEDSVGVKLFCLSGHVNQPGVVEVPFGLTVREIIERFGGGFQGEPQAILIGGAAGGFLHPDKFDTPLTNDALKPLDVPIGSGVIMAFNETVDLWEVLLGLAHFFVHETCGRCVPCRVGTTQIHAILENITSGRGSEDDLTTLNDLGRMIRESSVCGLGMTAANPVLTVLDHFDISNQV